MNIKATAAGVLVGMLLGGPAAVQAYDKVEKSPDKGYTITCTGNGAGGYRRCDVHVTEAPGAPVHRFDFNLYANDEFLIGIASWGYNKPRKDEDEDPDMVDSPLSRVVR